MDGEGLGGEREELGGKERGRGNCNLAGKKLIINNKNVSRQ